MFFILPSIQMLAYSFTYWDIFTTRWAGVENFKNLFVDGGLIYSIKNTFTFAFITTFFKVINGLVLAIFLNQKLRTRNYLRTVFFMPAILNTVAVGLIFSAIFHPITGLLNESLRFIGLDFLVREWLTDPSIAIYSVSFVEIWQWTGFNMVILLAGLQTIDKQYYEAADIDGASEFMKFKHITLPLIMPALNNAIVVSLIGGLKVFGIIQATTGGGPGRSTEVFATLIYRSFASGRYGEACAATLIQSIIIAIISLSVHSYLRKKEIEL
ncbi:carbohydrate ABC transporter permease [Vallitalea okinawensis]|uniref:carbohydrate ABC transporter permease n=1 Tax=Vallitalea okinawensis TaxID=2078660 RepID=UPI001FA8849E|nr:sugar ABC transporter permease [Vallitalea okinawensis]